jgi:hypothetical protein
MAYLGLQKMPIKTVRDDEDWAMLRPPPSPSYRTRSATFAAIEFKKIEFTGPNPGMSLLSTSLTPLLKNAQIQDDDVEKKPKLYVPPEILLEIAKYVMIHTPYEILQYCLVNSLWHSCFVGVLEKTVLVQVHQLGGFLKDLRDKQQPLVTPVSPKAKFNHAIRHGIKIERLLIVFGQSQIERFYWGRRRTTHETSSIPIPYTTKDCVQRAWLEVSHFLEVVRSEELLPNLRLLAIHGHNETSLSRNDMFDLFSNLTNTPKTNLWMTYHFAAELFAKRKRLGEKRARVDWGLTYSLNNVPWPEDANHVFPSSIRQLIRCLHLGEIKGWDYDRFAVIEDFASSLPTHKEFLLEESSKACAFVAKFREADLKLPHLTDIRAQASVMDSAKGGDLVQLVHSVVDDEPCLNFSITHTSVKSHVERIKKRIRDEVYMKMIGVVCSANLKANGDQVLELWT